MAKTNSTTALALTPEIEAAWTPAQVELIREMSAKNCTDDEFKVLLYVAHKYNLDPLTKQIYAQKYQGSNPAPAAIIITYAGMLEIANRMNMLDGMSSEVIYDGQGNLAGARSCLWKKGCTHPFQTEVDLEEYFQRTRDGKPQGLWGSKPKTMIRKVACAQNIRQAFSLGQMYIEEEMPQAEAAPSRQEVTEAQVIEQTIPAPRPIRPPAAPEKPRTVEQPRISEEERLKRIADAAAIDLAYGQSTVTGMGDFLSLSVVDTLKCIRAMTGCGSFAEVSHLIGLDGLEGEIRKRYPDTPIQAQRYAATLHFVFNWAKAQAELAAKREAAHATA